MNFECFSWDQVLVCELWKRSQLWFLPCQDCWYFELKHELTPSLKCDEWYQFNLTTNSFQKLIIASKNSHWARQKILMNWLKMNFAWNSNYSILFRWFFPLYKAHRLFISIAIDIDVFWILKTRPAGLETNINILHSAESRSVNSKVKFLGPRN